MLKKSGFVLVSALVLAFSASTALASDPIPGVDVKLGHNCCPRVLTITVTGPEGSPGLPGWVVPGGLGLPSPIQTRIDVPTPGGDFPPIASTVSNVLRTGHDTVKNAIGNIR